MTSNYEAKIARLLLDFWHWEKNTGESTKVLDLCLKNIQACWIS